MSHKLLYGNTRGWVSAFNRWTLLRLYKVKSWGQNLKISILLKVKTSFINTEIMNQLAYVDSVPGRNIYNIDLHIEYQENIFLLILE